MNVETVVSLLFSNDSDSDWNGSDEEEENYEEDDSLHVDRLAMEQGKMADTRGAPSLLYFVVSRR